ncbi:MAG: PilZ domain-containing protein [Roseinatronobacter sp.]
MLRVMFVLISLALSNPALAACVSQGLLQGAAPSWDQRDALARTLEVEASGLGIAADRVQRLALALRMGKPALGQLAAQDLALLAQLETGCDPPAQVANVEETASFGFDLYLGWPHLLGSIAVTGLSFGVLFGFARWNAALRRRRKRYFCSIDVMCAADGQDPERSRVRDLSLTGLRMTPPKAGAYPVGQNLTIDFGAFRMTGRIVSRNRHYLGVEFERDLTRAELLHLVRPEKYPTPFGGADARSPPA